MEITEKFNPLKIIFKLFRWLLIIAIAVFLCTPLALYLHGRSIVVDYLSPPEELVSEDMLTAYKKWLGMPDSSSYKKLNPYTFIFFELPREAARRKSGDIRAPYMDLYHHASRYRLFREVRGGKIPAWHLAQISAAIYISRNWTVNESISDLLLHQYSGRKTYGIVDASKLYFGLAPEQLSENQLYVLFRLPYAPGRYDPWCSPQDLRRSIEAHLGDRDIPYLWSDLNLLPNPKGAC